ncbi:MAG: ATP-binding response regulator [Actinomycetota bacterium]
MAVLRVLVVDDAAESRAILGRALAFDPSIEVVGEASSGREAVARTEELHPDVILMDVRMPEGDGVAATTDITRRFPDIRVLALTAHDDHESVREMLSAGATGYLVKGTSIDGLISAIRKAKGGEGQLDERVVPHALADLRTLLAQEQQRRADAERLAQAREEFMQVLSHELRTPLTVIVGALQYVKGAGLNHAGSDLVDAALNRAGDLERMVQGLELIGEVPPVQTSSNPADAVGLAMAELPERPDRVEVPEERWIGVHPHHLARVAHELVSNALIHGKRPVEVRVWRQGREGVLRVTDAGDLQPDPSLLGPFTQGDMSTQRTRGGLGLGLFVAARLCEKAGGRLELRRDGDLTVAEARFGLGG